MSEYEQFLWYLEQNSLLEIHSLRPIVNGEKIVKTLAMKSGPWVMKAQDLLIRWQLLNPENTDQQQALDFLVGQKAELEAGNQKNI
jgi:tRNA nucleotidyltransferase (CCA-adding enzyme)